MGLLWEGGAGASAKRMRSEKVVGVVVVSRCFPPSYHRLCSFNVHDCEGPFGWEQGRSSHPPESLRIAWQATCRGKAKGWANGSQGIRWLDDGRSEALRADIVEWLKMPGNHRPNVWSPGHASFIPKRKSG